MALVSVTEGEVYEHWRTRPCDEIVVEKESDRLELINQYFTRCARGGRRPLLTGAALAAGYSGVTEMRRAAMRHPELRHALSRVFTTVASYYEEMIGVVSGQGPIFMLKNMPDYDDLSPTNAPAQQAFQERLVIEERIAGVKSIEEEGMELPPRVAYLKLIRGEVVEDEAPTVVNRRVTQGIHIAVNEALEQSD